MKRRWEYAEAQLKTAREEIASLKNELAESEKDYEAAHAAAHEIAEQKDAEIAALRMQIIEADDLENLLILAIERKTALDEEVKNAAERIVESAGEPESAAFKNAVSDHRAAKRAAEKYTALIERASKAKR